RRVLGGDPEVVGKNLGRHRRGGEADDGTLAVLTLPRSTQRVHGRGLPGAGRADQHVENATGDGDLYERVGLVVTEHPPVSIRLRGDLLDRRHRDGRSGRGAGAVEQPVLGGQEQLGGEHGGV